MPCVSEFYGIAVYMYYNDHNPPHFHVEYGGKEALFAIESLRLLRGKLPRRVRSLAIEWASERQDALLANWALARQGLPLEMIEPLE